jgi:hypothetical protein
MSDEIRCVDSDAPSSFQDKLSAYPPAAQATNFLKRAPYFTLHVRNA